MTPSRDTNPIDPAMELKRCWPLDMIVPLDEEADGRVGALLSRWSDLAVADLPFDVQHIALAEPASWREIAQALTEPGVVAAACDMFVQGVRSELVSRYGDRDATIALARAGITSDDVPTLESLGRGWNLTRERVRQLARDITKEAEAALDWRSPLRLVVGAWLALHRGTPLIVDNFAPPDTARARTLQLAFDAMQLPRPSCLDDVWVETSAERRAVEALVDALPNLIVRARSRAELEAVAADSLPHIAEVLDLEATLRLLADRLDFGLGLDGMFAFGHAALVRRVAAKIVTYLQRRTAPITPTELAQAVQKGVPPFEPFHRPLIEPEWLVDCARQNVDYLALHEDGRIALARRLGHLRPTGNIAILHSIVVDHGEPMRMIDLCDRAAEFGISRNQVGVFIHSGRAACLLMLDRGIVGLVGRDEGADPSQYAAASPGATRRVRVGEDIGFDSEGRIVADIEIRRSIREQGFALPWPFSIIYFSNQPELLVNGKPRTIIVRGNGDLDINELEPGSHVRLRLALTKNGHRLSIECTATDSTAPVRDAGFGAYVPVGLPSLDDRPGWIDVVLENTGVAVEALENVVRQMPHSMAPKRRVRALYALVALGLLQPERTGWRCCRERPLPAELAEAFATMESDPSSYAVLPRQQQAAVGWLVWATWLVPNLGWERVRPNDLADAGADDERAAEIGLVATSSRETALMRIVEAAHQADDMHRHPHANGGADATSTVVRRYLTALGYTAYNAVRDLDAAAGSRVLSVRPGNDADVSAIWMLQPLGTGVDEKDLNRVQKIARTEHVSIAVATDGLQLIAIDNGTMLALDLRKIGRNQMQFDQLTALAADPDLLRATD